jgi:hypothetical protein
MSLQPPHDDLTKHKLIVVGTLLAALVTALAQVMGVLPALDKWLSEVQVTHNSGGPVGSPTADPIASPTASPVATSTSMTASSRKHVCGAWRSDGSRKQYDFVCNGPNSFEIYEVSGQALNKNGSGKLTEEGDIEADLTSFPKNRKAYLKLSVSADGQKLEGTWRGDDPRESGRLMFRRI